MNEELYLSASGMNLIKHFEGCRKEVGPNKFGTFECPEGVMGIGFGHKTDFGRVFIATDVWSDAECDRVLQYDLSLVTARLRRLVNVRLNQTQFDALASFMFNITPDAFARSKVLEQLNARNLTGALEEMMRWDHSAGELSDELYERRERECALFQYGTDTDYSADPMVAPVPMPGNMPLQVDVPLDSTGPITTNGPKPETEPTEERAPTERSETQDPPLRTEEADG